MTPELLHRGKMAAKLLQAAYKWKLASYPGLVLVDWCPQEDAILARVDGKVWLIVPGSGYGHASRWSRGERLMDWLGNLAAQWPVRLPAIGKSGLYRWAWGFLRPARRVELWLADRHVDYACGHSRGAAIVSIVAWSASYRNDPSRVTEAHAIAPPRVCFTRDVPVMRNLNCWTATDDRVCGVPFGAVHAGVEHAMPEVNRRGEEHTIDHYLTRFDRMIAAQKRRPTS